MAADNAMPLDGVTVVDIGTLFAGPMIATHMADFGAEAIKVEHPRGDSLRSFAPQKDGISLWWKLTGRNKKSITCNLSAPEGQEILKKLVVDADVLIENFRPGTLEKWELSWEVLHRLNPKLILVRCSGFGQEGPYAGRPGFGTLAEAMSGYSHITGEAEGPPTLPGFALADGVSAMCGTYAVMMALYHRDESGQGQEVDASLLGGNMYSQSLDMQAYLAIRDDRFLEPIGRLDASNPMSGPMYPCSDGRWVTLAMPDTDKYWPAFAEITELDVDDPRFDTHEKRCEENRLEMLALLEEIFHAKPGSHWKSELDRKQLPADVIERYAYPASDTAAEANRYIVNVDHPVAGSVKSLGFPVHMAAHPAEIRRRAPAPGEHTEEILGELRGTDAS